uniref:Uncharacterized protein n=1 Tax=Anopheles culicifacies TaxID=139723 RepID=A0A182M8T7_9DIPT
MRYIKRNDRTAAAPKWTLHILLILVGVVVLLLAESVQSQQANRRKPTPRHKCPLPIEELDSLVDLLSNIEQEPQPDQPEEDYEEESSEAVDTESQTPQLDPHCARELKKLRDAVNHLQRSYYDLKQSPSTLDERLYRYRERSYTQQKQKLTAQLDELSKQINSQDRSQLLQLRRKINEVEKQLNETVSKLAQQRQTNKDNFIRLVASNIGTNRIVSAIANFNQLLTYSIDPYGEIVQKVFATGNVQAKTTAMLQFLQKVDFQHRPVLGYDALVDELIALSALNGPNAIELLKHIQCIILARDGDQQAEALALLKKFKSNAH